eukprot:105246_1
MIDICLQKDPSKRPNCEELLNHEHFRPLRDEGVRLSRKERTKEEICDLIPNVGDELERKRKENKSRRDDEKQVEQDKNNHILPASFVSEMEENVPSGTTWIFSEGSHVTASGSSENANAKTKTTEEEDQDFFDTFERATHGEDFIHPSIQEEPRVGNAREVVSNGDVNERNRKKKIEG